MVHQLFFFNYKRQRRTDSTTPSRGDLTISAGDFLVTDTGVMCRLKDPLSKLSGHYSWSRIPLGIATLKLLVVAPDTDAFEVVMKMFSHREQKLLADGIGSIMSFDEPVEDVDKSAFLAQDIERILSWAPLLANKCPLSSVAKDLKLLPSMRPEVLGSFVGNKLGLG